MLGLVLGCHAYQSSAVPPTPIRPTSWEICFSPGGRCTALIVQTLDRATHTVHLQAYSFTSGPIAQALVEAHRRGVVVEALVDQSQLTARGAQAGVLADAGIPVRIDAAHAIAHNKVIVVDGETVLTGSFNFTEAAEARNAENLLVVRDRALAERYDTNWRHHQAHSTSYP